MKTQWDFSPLVSENIDEQIEKEKIVITKEVSEFISKWNNKKYLINPESLKEALDDYENLMKNYGTSGNVGYFLWLKKMKNQSDEEIKSKYNLVDEFSKKTENSLNFFTIDISKISDEKQKEFLKSDKLKKYKHYLERLFRTKKHLLSEVEEKIITLKNGPAFENWVDMTSEILAKEERKVFTGKKEEIKNFAEIIAMINDSNKKIRDSCAKALNDILAKNSDIAAAEINSILQNKKIDDELRNYTRADESRIISDDIDFEFIDELINTVKNNFALSRKYYELKAKLLGFKKLEYHERNVVYGKINKKISYDEAIKLIGKIFKNTDEEFGKIFDNMILNGFVDVYPSLGKKQGAFCTYGLKIHPIYVLLNYTEDFDDLRTMAHELGHAVNHELIKKQNSLNFGSSMAIAETASNFFEGIFFNEFLAKTNNEEEKLSFLMAELNEEISSVIRQVSCYLFEKKLHEEFRKKGNLSKEEIGKIFSEKMSDYMGDFVEKSIGSENWWVYWLHIRKFFYVYSYSSGLLIAKTMIRKLNENPKFINEIKKFLSAGWSNSPKELIKLLGIDTGKKLWEEGLYEIEKELNDTWALAEKLGKI